MFGWGSPIGIAIFIIGLGIFLYLISHSSKQKDKK